MTNWLVYTYFVCCEMSRGLVRLDALHLIETPLQLVEYLQHKLVMILVYKSDHKLIDWATTDHIG